MNNLPTVEEFMTDEYQIKHYGTILMKPKQSAIEFAKLHLEAQQKAIIEKVKQEIACDAESTEHFNLSVNPSIINAYPLDLIK